MEIFDCLMGFAFKVSILLYFQKQTNSLVLPSLVCFSYFTIRIITNLICRGKKSILESEEEFADSIEILQAEKQANSFYFVINNWVFRIYCVSQAIFYSLKVEQYIEWNWSEVFWVYWVFFCIIIGITLIITLLLIVKICDFCQGAKNERIENVLTAIDSANFTEGKTANEIVALQQNVVDAQQLLLPIIYQVAAGFAAQLLYYLISKNQISAFVKLIMFEYGGEEEEEEQEQDQNQRNQPNQNQVRDSSRSPPKKVRMAYKSKLVLEEKEVAPTMNLPQFVSKISSTYFRFLASKKDVQSEMIKKSQNSKQKKQQAAQQQTAQVLPSTNKNLAKNMKSVGRAFSIRSLNRSATATVTMQTQGNTNTQADMLQSSRLHTQDKQFSDQNEFEDVFKEGSSGSQDKKDLRGENFIKKNIKAQNKQKLTDLFISPKEINAQKFHFPPNGSHDKIESDEIQENFGDRHNVLSPVGGFDFHINNQRRQTSMANPFLQLSNKSKGQNPLNMTAPFKANPSQNNIYEEDEDHESYYYEKNKEQNNNKLSQQKNNDEIIRFDDYDDESQNNNTKNQESSQMTSSIQQQSVSTCLVCFDAIPDSIFNPCGHGGLCYECAIDLMKKTGECYLCRTKIEEILKIDVESKNQGIMKIITTTKLVKVREKIEISEQEYQYYTAIRRNRRLQQQNLGSGQNQHLQNNGEQQNQQQIEEQQQEQENNQNLQQQLQSATNRLNLPYSNNLNDLNNLNNDSNPNNVNNQNNCNNLNIITNVNNLNNVSDPNYISNPSTYQNDFFIQNNGDQYLAHDQGQQIQSNLINQNNE